MLEHNRKLPRLQGYDYSDAGKYFVTICTQRRQPLFGDIFCEQMHLSHFGTIAQECLRNLSLHDCVTVDRYVFMPDHLHAIVSISGPESSRPNLSSVIQRYKSITTVRYIDGVKSGIYPPFQDKIWQSSFYDRVIRSENEYIRICRYIDENPLKFDLLQNELW